MNRIEFRDLISLEKARERLRTYIEPKIIEKKLENCFGAALGEDVFSEIDVPAFDRAAMDGYAVKASDTHGAEEDNPIRLNRVGEVLPGELKEIEVEEGEAIEVATGAVLPEGANAVVMIEHINEFDDEIEVRKAVAPSENIMYAGSDIMAGEKVLTKGSILNARDIGVLAAIGKEEVKVLEPPRIGIISIGDELASPGNELGSSEIFDTNSFSIRSALDEIGVETTFYGIVGDEKDKIREKIMEAISENEIVLTSGSTSAGSSDHLHSVLDKGELLFHGVAIKPGKPTLATRVRNSLLIGLPGYPTSALTIYNLLIDPLLREAVERESEEKEIEATTITKVRSVGGRRHFHPVGLVRRDNNYYLYPIEKGSGAITSLAQAEGFIEIKENQEYIREESKKTVRLFSKQIELPAILFMGSHSVGVDLIRQELDFSSKSINVGSRGGIRMIKKGVPDVSGIHLINDKDVYNLPIVKEKEIDGYLVKGYLREQGFIVKKNNPKQIKNISDLINKPIRLINRNKGSGTRKLLEMELKKFSHKNNIGFEEAKENIKGYNVNSKTHSGVASAVKLDKADVGIGTKYFAKEKDLDFVKITDEEFDFLINKDSVDKESVQEFLKYLKSEEFKDALVDVDGIKTYERSGELIELD